MDFSEKEYIGMDLREENWEEQELTGVRFVGCRFHGANMMGLVTRNCWFEDCDFSFARLEDINVLITDENFPADLKELFTQKNIVVM